MKQWLFSEIKSHQFSHPIPSLSAQKGTERLLLLSEILGSREAAKNLAEDAGRYELSDALVAQVQHKGLQLGQEGEVPALSPCRWNFSLGVIPEGKLLGILMEREKIKKFLDFLQLGNAPATMEATLELARHFFYEDSLNLVVEYTLPRFNQP